MNIISFEGLDSCGKATQSKLLRDYLMCRGYSVKHVEYPDSDDTRTFNSIREHLKGVKKLNSVELEILYALNKRTILEHMRSLRSESNMRSLHGESNNNTQKIIIVDRYKESQYAYAGALGHSLDFLKKLNEDLPDSDFVIYLNVDKPYYKETKDDYENDRKFQDLVRLQYDKILRDRKSMMCLYLTGHESIDTVFHKIIKGVDDFLNRRVSYTCESC